MNGRVPPPQGHSQTASSAPPEPCDHCGADQLVWRKCKLVCLNCGQINKSCADL